MFAIAFTYAFVPAFLTLLAVGIGVDIMLAIEREF